MTPTLFDSARHMATRSMHVRTDRAGGAAPARNVRLDEASAGLARRLAVATGALFLITHVTSVPAGLIVAPVLTDAERAFTLPSGFSLAVAGLLEVICAVAVVGTAVALFPVVKRRSEAGALGYVGLRTLEAAVIAAGVVPLLALSALRQPLGDAGGGDATALGVVFAELHAWSRLVGPGLICGANTTVMAYLLHASRLVPRAIPTLGLIGGPLVFAHSAAQLLGVPQEFLAWTTLAVVPIFAWELSLAIWLLARGFSRRTEEAVTSMTYSLTPQM